MSRAMYKAALIELLHAIFLPAMLYAVSRMRVPWYERITMNNLAFTASDCRALCLTKMFVYFRINKKSVVITEQCCPKGHFL